MDSDTSPQAGEFVVVQCTLATNKNTGDTMVLPTSWTLSQLRRQAAALRDEADLLAPPDEGEPAEENAQARSMRGRAAAIEARATMLERRANEIRTDFGYSVKDVNLHLKKPGFGPWVQKQRELTKIDENGLSTVNRFDLAMFFFEKAVAEVWPGGVGSLDVAIGEYAFDRFAESLTPSQDRLLFF